ncbi:MAG: hypothetical protein ACREQ5_39940 [Candidatus Dormibacteria bacterium]
MRDSGYLGKFQNPSSEHLAEYMPRLNRLFNYLQTQGLKLWLNEDFSITPIQGQNLYSLGSGGALLALKPLRVLEGYYLDNASNRRPIIPMSRNEWDSLSTVNTQGTLTSYFVDKQQLALNVYVWLTPDAQTALGTFHPILQYQVGNVVSLTDIMNFPIEWYLALEWGFANQICTGQPQAIMDRCERFSMKYLNDLENWDVEDASTFFSPDTRTMNNIGRFQ